MSTERNEYKTGQWDSAVGPALGAAAAISSKSLVPEARLELARLAAADFEFWRPDGRSATYKNLVPQTQQERHMNVGPAFGRGSVQ